jgi:hypothetical protein
MNKKWTPYRTVLTFTIFVMLGLACGQTAYSQTFPSDFMGTWKRDNFSNTLTFTANTVKSSSSNTTWNLTSISRTYYFNYDNDSWVYSCNLNSGRSGLTLNIRPRSSGLEISGDSGSGENNWNGVWKKTQQRRDAEAAA